MPREGERTLTLAAVGKASDKKAAWAEVAKTLSATKEARKHAAELNKANPTAPSPGPDTGLPQPRRRSCHAAEVDGGRGIARAT